MEIEDDGNEYVFASSAGRKFEIQIVDRWKEYGAVYQGKIYFSKYEGGKDKLFFETDGQVFEMYRDGENFCAFVERLIRADLEAGVRTDCGGWYVKQEN